MLQVNKVEGVFFVSGVVVKAPSPLGAACVASRLGGSLSSLPGAHGSWSSFGWRLGGRLRCLGVGRLAVVPSRRAWRFGIHLHDLRPLRAPSQLRLCHDSEQAMLQWYVLVAKI
jgi:hypothetical protein